MRINGSFNPRRKQIIETERGTLNARGGKPFIHWILGHLNYLASLKLQYKRGNESTSVWRIKAESSVKFFLRRNGSEKGINLRILADTPRKATAKS